MSWIKIAGLQIRWFQSTQRYNALGYKETYNYHVSQISSVLIVCEHYREHPRYRQKTPCNHLTHTGNDFLARVIGQEDTRCGPSAPMKLRASMSASSQLQSYSRCGPISAALRLGFLDLPEPLCLLYILHLSRSGKLHYQFRLCYPSSCFDHPVPRLPPPQFVRDRFRLWQRTSASRRSHLYSRSRET